MRTRFLMSVALIFAALALTYAGSHFSFAVSPPPAHAALPPIASSYLGVYEEGAPPEYQPVADFAKVAGSQPNLVGYYSGWAEPFATSYAERIRSHGSTP